MRLLLCRTCLQYSFSLLRFIMKEWFCRYGTGPPMVKWYYSICKHLQFIVDIRNRNRKKNAQNSPYFWKEGCHWFSGSIFFLQRLQIAPWLTISVNRPKWLRRGWGGLGVVKKRYTSWLFQSPKYFLLECSDSLVWLKLYKCTAREVIKSIN